MDRTQHSESPTRPAKKPSRFGSFTRSLQRHTIAYAVGGGVLVAALIGGGAAWASTPSQASSSIVASSSSARPEAAQTHAKAHHPKKKHEIVGVITAITGSTWSLRTHRNTVLTITTSSTTAYGTVKKPTTASSFTVGERVVVRGHRSGSTVTAKRILHAHAVHLHASSTSTSATA